MMVSNIFHLLHTLFQSFSRSLAFALQVSKRFRFPCPAATNFTLTQIAKSVNDSGNFFQESNRIWKLE